ncbi:unnamed protein product, partial [Discosporangium mesarthrocarpum]
SQPPWYYGAPDITLHYPQEETGRGGVIFDAMVVLKRALMANVNHDTDPAGLISLLEDVLTKFFGLKGLEGRGQREETCARGGLAAGSPVKQARTLPPPPPPPLPGIPCLSNGEGGVGGGEGMGGHQGGPSSATSAAAGSPKPKEHNQGQVRVLGYGGGQENSPVAEGTTPLPSCQEIFFSTTDFYLFLRVHYLLVDRLTVARRLCREASASEEAELEDHQRAINDFKSRTEDIAGLTGVLGKEGSAPTGMETGEGPSTRAEADTGAGTGIGTGGEAHTGAGIGAAPLNGEGGQDAYESYLLVLNSWLEGSIGSDQYEESVIAIMGNK